MIFIIRQRRKSIWEQDIISSTQSRSSRYYNMKHKHRGYALIFNHYVFYETKYPPRIGTEMDVAKLKETLPLLGVKDEHIKVYEDYSWSKMKKVARDLEHDSILEESDCIMIFILSHGKDDNKVMACDVPYDLFEFVALFTPKNLESLATKPKLFFVQACRGDDIDDGHTIRPMGRRAIVDEVDFAERTYTHPTYADLSIAYSSHHGHFSFRNQSGSWFMQDLCEVLQNIDLKENDLNDILMMTNSKVAERDSVGESLKLNEKKQISSFYMTLIKKVYFDNNRQ